MCDKPWKCPLEIKGGCEHHFPPLFWVGVCVGVGVRVHEGIPAVVCGVQCVCVCGVCVCVQCVCVCVDVCGVQCVCVCV